MVAWCDTAVTTSAARDVLEPVDQKQRTNMRGRWTGTWALGNRQSVAEGHQLGSQMALHEARGHVLDIYNK
jgi:hypothetical protein